MNLRHLNLVGHCTMCMLPVVALRSVSWRSFVSPHGGSRCIEPLDNSMSFGKAMDQSGARWPQQSSRYMITHVNMRRGNYQHRRVPLDAHGRGSAFRTARQCASFGSIGKDEVQSFAEVKVASASRMEEIGAFFGSDTQNGDTVLLHGDLGTGKTCFARGFIRARIGKPSLAVTSPSYLLDNTYHVEDEDITLHHMDLYRLQGGADLGVLDIPNVMKKNVCLIEWPDRLGATKPVNRLDVHLTAASEDERVVTITGHGAWWAGVVEDFQEYRERTPGGHSSRLPGSQ